MQSDAMDYTTISFDFDANPPAAQLPQHSTSSHIPSQHSEHFPSYDSTSSSSLVYIAPDHADDLFCQPFITTPEPTMSPSIFDSAPFPPSIASPTPPDGRFDENSAILHNQNYDPYMPSPSMSLLPLLLPSQPMLTNLMCSNNYYNIGMSTNQQPAPYTYYARYENGNLRDCLPSSDGAFLNNGTFEPFITAQPQTEFELIAELSPFIVLQPQPQAEFEIIAELSPFDGTLIYTQL